jgi:hypothetical protein
MATADDYGVPYFQMNGLLLPPKSDTLSCLLSTHSE